GREDLTHRFVEDTAENIYSVSKTVTALAVGIAAEEGLLDPEDLLSDHLPAPAGGYGTGIEQVRLRHLLTMTSGSPVLGFLDEQREHPDLTSLLLGTDLIEIGRASCRERVWRAGVGGRERGKESYAA